MWAAGAVLSPVAWLVHPATIRRGARLCGWGAQLCGTGQMIWAQRPAAAPAWGTHGNPVCSGPGITTGDGPVTVCQSWRLLTTRDGGR